MRICLSPAPSVMGIWAECVRKPRLLHPSRGFLFCAEVTGSHVG